MITNKEKNQFKNHLLKNGKKQISEKILIKNFKAMQKSKKKSHSEIIKLAIINTTPTFRVIKLKNKRKKKKSVNEIPAFLSTYNYRTSWAINYLIKMARTIKNNNIFSNKLEQEIMLSSKHDSNSVTFKKEIQTRAIQKKRYIKNYRW